MDWALWYLKVRLWKFDGIVSEKMPRITVEALIEQLRNELKALGISNRAAEKRAGICRRKLDEGAEQRFCIFDLLRILEAVGIEAADFFARAFYKHALNRIQFGKLGKGKWSRRRSRILNAVAKVKERGSYGFMETRNELRRIEHLRDTDPEACEAAALEFLKQNQAPGALVGGLAILLAEASIENANQLLKIAFDLLGPDLRSAAGGKLTTAMGRNLYMQRSYRAALEVLQDHALPIVALFGSGEEHALVAYYVGVTCSKVGESATRAVALEKTIEIGSERLQFAAWQHLAFEELNGGNIQNAAQMYDQVTSLPWFERADPRAKATVNWSRLTAHFLAGRLDGSREAEFRAAVEATTILDPSSRLLASLDLALFLRTIGKNAAAQELLKAEHWNVLDLGDPELQDKFCGLWLAVGLPESGLSPRLPSPKEARYHRPHPQPNQQKQDQGPAGREEGPKE